jgi:hypothetical protein
MFDLTKLASFLVIEVGVLFGPKLKCFRRCAGSMHRSSYHDPLSAVVLASLSFFDQDVLCDVYVSAWRLAYGVPETHE